MNTTKGGIQLPDDDAFESDFVDDVLEPFPAHDRAEAERIAKAKLDNLKAAH